MKDETNGSQLKKRMENLHKNIDEMKGDKFRISEINLDYIKKELLNPDFMEKNTDFPSFEAMIQSGSFKVENEIEFEDITNTIKWNKHIVKNTSFKSWKEMLRIAVLERATSKLKLT